MARFAYRTGSTAVGHGPAGLLSSGCLSGERAGNRDIVAVTITDEELSIVLAGKAKAIQAGTYRFAISNAGRHRHNLSIQGPGMQRLTCPAMSSGASAELIAVLQTGTYRLWCSLDDDHLGEGFGHLVIE